VPEITIKSKKGRQTMSKKEIKITNKDGNKLSIAALLEGFGYDVYQAKRSPAYLAALIFDKCGFPHMEIIKLILKNYPLLEKELANGC
jgi:hypothetical protein